MAGADAGPGADKAGRRIARAVARVLFAARWLLAPLYLGLAAGLALIAVRFAVEFVHALPAIATMSDVRLVLLLLSLVDLVLVGNLLLIVLLSGYEEFVSHLGIESHPDRPDWMGEVDFSVLKRKLMSSLTAIAAVQLLRSFMEVEHETDRRLGWELGIMLAFVAAGVLLAVMDRLGEHAPAEDEARSADFGITHRDNRA